MELDHRLISTLTLLSTQHLGREPRRSPGSVSSARSYKSVQDPKARLGEHVKFRFEVDFSPVGRTEEHSHDPGH